MKVFKMFKVVMGKAFPTQKSKKNHVRSVFNNVTLRKIKKTNINAIGFIFRVRVRLG